MTDDATLRALYPDLDVAGFIITGAGRLSCRAIIHVAGINMLWRASEYSIRESVSSAMSLVNANGFASVAFPIIGAGSGGFGAEGALRLMLDAFAGVRTSAETVIVRYRPEVRSAPRTDGAAG